MSPVNPRVAREAENLEKMRTPPQKLQKMIFNFDATLAEKATDVAAVNLMETALGNQKTPLLNHVSEKAATIQNASRRMLPGNPRVAREAENLAKMKTPPQRHQKKTILNFDATLAAKATDVVDVNLMATALGNQKTPLLNHVSEKAATIQNASRRMLPVNPRVAREAENRAKIKTPPQKHQKKMILNFDATLAAKATDVVAANLMATALGNQKTPPLNHVSEKAATIQNVNRRMLLVNPRVARETANLEKMKTPPQKLQKMILNFDATFAKMVAAVNLMATALGNQKTPLLNHVSEKAATIQDVNRR